MSGIGGFGNYDTYFDDEMSDDFYKAIFEQHPVHEEHFIHKGHSLISEEHAQNLIQHISDNTNKFVNEEIGSVKKLVDLSAETEIIEDDQIMNKYAELADESYNHYEDKPKVVNEFEKVSELNTNKNNVVMESKDEIHMSFRGTMQKDDWTDNNTKILSRHTFGDIENTTRYKEAEDQLLNIIDYAKRVGKKLTLSGHSLGAHLSYDLAQKYDLEGYHFQPAISMKQIQQQINKTFANNKNVQKIFRTHSDLPSIRIPQFYDLFKKSVDTVVKNIGSKTSLDNSLTKVHSLEHFTKNASKIRNTPTGSVLKSLSTATALGVQGYFTAKDVKEDQKTKNPITNSTIDVIKNVGELAGGLAIGAALGPELAVPALISGAIFNVGMEHMAHEIKTTGVQVANVVKKAFVDGKDIHGKSIGKRIKNELKEKDVFFHKEIGSAFKKSGRAIKHFFGF